MKRILISLATSGAVLATVVFATNSFFSDVETSTGNTFQAGTLDLKVDYEGYYNKDVDNEPNAGNWTLKDLGETDKFFNFTDVKPGDFGEGTISLHVEDNNAWACATITNVNNPGELAQNLNFKIWADVCNTNSTPGDNIYQPECDRLLTQGTGPTTSAGYTLADSTGNVFTGTVGPALTGAQTYYLGVSWDLPSTVGNEVQGDTYQADIAFYTEQERHNAAFKCSDRNMQTVVVNPNSMNGWFGYNDETDVVDNNLVSFVAGPSTPPAGTGSVQSIVSGTQRRNIATQLFGGTKLADITELKFSTYQPNSNPGSTTRAAYLQFNVDFTNTNTWQRRLIWVPSVNGSTTVLQNTWQTWDAYNSGNAMWGWSGFAANGNKWPDNNVNEFRSWNDIKTAWPNAKMLSPGAFFGLRFGEPYADGFTGYADKVVVGTNGFSTVYDFEQ